MSLSASLGIPREVEEELTRDPIARKILITIFKMGTVKPRIGLETGIRYPPFEDLPNWRSVIEKLIKLKLVDRSVADRLVHCPRCGSIHVSSRLLCPWCKSFNIEPTYIIQHTLCGYIDTESKFRDPNTGQLICPKCKRPLRKEGLDYVVIGKVFECLNCKRKSNKPMIVFYCRNCSHQFDYLNTVYEPVYEYSLTPLGQKVVTSGALHKQDIIEALEELGLQVEAPGKEKGRSGIDHTFDILARTPQGRVLAIDFAEEKDPSLAITSRVPKALDTGVDRYIIILPSNAFEASMLVQMKNVIVLDLTEPYLVERIKAIAKELLKKETKEVEVTAEAPPELSEEQFFGEIGAFEEKEPALSENEMLLLAEEEEEKKEGEEGERKKEKKEGEKKELLADEFFGG
ncbi:MAG: hypothetical protein GXO07_01400 [Crenarchaeota archaeon]|nr:hypothetical protein [Thermoproteota archaeon]